jgi:hypothetical protein
VPQAIVGKDKRRLMRRWWTEYPTAVKYIVRRIHDAAEEPDVFHTWYEAKTGVKTIIKKIAKQHDLTKLLDLPNDKRLHIAVSDKAEFWCNVATDQWHDEKVFGALGALREQPAPFFQPADFTRKAVLTMASLFKQLRDKHITRLEVEVLGTPDGERLPVVRRLFRSSGRAAAARDDYEVSNS